MKKISIDISDKEYYGCISGKIKEKDPSNCSYDDLYDFSKSMLKAIAVGKPEDPPIEVGDIVVKYGGVLNELYGIVTHKQDGVYTVMFNDGHTALILEDGLHPIGSNYKDLLTKIFEHITKGI